LSCFLSRGGLRPASAKASSAATPGGPHRPSAGLRTPSYAGCQLCLLVRLRQTAKRDIVAIHQIGISACQNNRDPRPLLANDLSERNALSYWAWHGQSPPLRSFPRPQDFRGTCRGGGLDDVTESVQHLEGRQAREDYDGALVVLSNGRRPPSGFASGAFSARFNRAISN
jgi:hypothetical protein